MKPGVYTINPMMSAMAMFQQLGIRGQVEVLQLCALGELADCR